LPIEELSKAHTCKCSEILDLRRKVLSIRQKKKIDISIDDEAQDNQENKGIQSNN